MQLGLIRQALPTGAAVAVCAGFLGSAFGFPQTDVREQVEVALRLIDVTVVDGKKKPLADLGREDFVVTVDGGERAIRSFDRAAGGDGPVSTIVRGDPVPRIGPPDLDRPGRWVVLCLDAERIPTNYRKVVLETARALIDQGEPRDRFAVALLQNGELHFIQLFAPADEVNLSRLQNAGMLLGHDPDLRYRVDELVRLMRTCGDNRDQMGCAATRSEEFLAVARRKRERGIEAIRGLIASMAPLPGRKALVWFSNGFVLQPGQVVLDAVTRELEPSQHLVTQLQYGERTEFDSLLAEATDARVTFFGLRAGHDMSYALRSAEHATVRRPISGEVGNAYKLANRMGEETLRDTAEATGGSVVFTPLRPEATIGLLDRLDGVYTLGVEVLPGDRPGSKVKVKLRNEKGKVQVRKQFPQARAQRSSFAATLEPLPPSGAVLVVDLTNVTPERDRRHDSELNRLAIYARIRSADGPVLDDQYVTIEVPRSDGEALLRHPIVFDLPPGEYAVEVSVSDLVGHGRATATTKIEPKD